MMKTKTDNLRLSSGASHIEVPIDKTLSPKHNRHKRDSGYSTDFSPSSVTGKTRHFTFDSDAGDLEFDLGDEFQNMDLSNDVFTDEGRGYSDADSDEADKEVETLFSDSEGLGEVTVLSNLTEVKMFRPAAPIPSPFGTSSENNDSVRSKCGDNALHHALQQTYWDRLYHEAHFRPISRSPEAQTPSSQSKMIVGPADLPRPRFQPYSIGRGSSVSRSTAPPVNKHQSNNAPLPDIVPESRDRSVSRPEMPSISQRYEQEVAQRLRRINDEFGFASETDRMRRSPSSFTFSLDIMRCINSVRKYIPPALNDSPEKTD